MNDQIERRELHIQPPYAIQTAIVIALAALALWGAMQAFSAMKEFRYIGAGISAANTITISGEGEVFAVPDIATFTVGVTEEAAEVNEAQEAAAQKMNAIIAFLKKEGIEERDIRTVGYNVYPRYEYRPTAQTGDMRFPSPGERELVGFEVTQRLEVRVRETDRAGELLSGVGALGATDVSGLSFTIDDDEVLKAEARKQAIADAQEKARDLANDLGVRIVRVVGFNENQYGSPMMRTEMGAFDGAVQQSAQSPDVPLGENRIVSNVSVTFEIR